MEGRTYRYFEGEVLYPFGHGLSFSTFVYDNLILEKQEISPGEPLSVSVEVTNTGKQDGEEVVQMYIRKPDSPVVRPLKDLRGFERVFINRGQTRVVTLNLGSDELAYYDTEAGEYLVEKGHYEIMVGPSSEEAKLIKTGLLVR